VLGYGRSVRVQTKGALERALQDAAAADEMTLIEVIIPRNDSSLPLRRFAAALATLRDGQNRS
jgi:thiamine pyrophosphate-dependent acetolactate synthase large subunit-like protein